MIEIVCDFETASWCDLKQAGAWVYSQHPTTEVLCLVWDYEASSGVWRPGDDTSILAYLAAYPTAMFVSHAAFEQAIWANIMVPLYGLPPLPPERWHDTQAVCAWRSLPLGLDKVSKVLRLQTQKDKEGSRLTIGLSKPMTKAAHMEEYPGFYWGTKADWARTFVPGTYDRRPKTLQRVVEYCKTDVAGEAELHQCLGQLSPGERKVWLLDQEINQRGIRLDMDFVRAAQQVVDRASAQLEAEFLDLTGGVKPGQVSKVIEWCGTQGVALDNLQKGYLEELLDKDAEGDDYVSLAEDAATAAVSDGNEGRDNSGLLPPQCRRVLTIRQMLGSASIKKLGRMQACVCDDGRARYLVQYHAAGPGRWGGRLLQPHNFPRGSLKLEYGFDGAGKPIVKAPPPQMVVDAIMTGDPDYVQAVLGAPPIECVASGLRHAIIADPGKVLEVGDFAGIEARMVLALAGQHDKCELMASGADVYLDMACDIYNVPKGSLNKNEHVAERTIGKNTVLGCGFQMGVNKFHDRYCPEQPLSFAFDVVEAYRTTWAPKVPELWAALDNCAWTTVRFGRTTEAYGCVFRIEGEWMTITLPSGWQKLWYFAPGMRPKKNRPEQDGPSYMAMKLGKWQQIDLYGGIVTENVVQALARGLLVEAMFRLERAGHPLVLTVHDEAVSEVDEGRADKVWYERTMAQPTAWSERIKVPVDVEAWVGARYKK